MEGFAAIFADFDCSGLSWYVVADADDDGVIFPGCANASGVSEFEF